MAFGPGDYRDGYVWVQTLMRIIDPGHAYELLSLDGYEERYLVFVQRHGPNYPGNTKSHPGTTMQDVLHCLVDRAKYVNNQFPCLETELVLRHFEAALVLLEMRAARVKGKFLPFKTVNETNAAEISETDGHIIL